MNPNSYDKAMEELEKDYNSGELTNKQFRQFTKELDEDFNDFHQQQLGDRYYEF